MPQYNIQYEDTLDCWYQVACAVVESGYENTHPTVTAEDLRDVVVSYVMNDDTVCITARSESGRIVGFIAGVIGYTNNLRPNDLVATEISWWVHEDHRKGSVGIRLLKEFEEWASGADTVVLTHYVNETGSRLSELYKRKGYKPTEVTYMKENK